MIDVIRTYAEYLERVKSGELEYDRNEGRAIWYSEQFMLLRQGKAAPCIQKIFDEAHHPEKIKKVCKASTD